MFAAGTAGLVATVVGWRVGSSVACIALNGSEGINIPLAKYAFPLLVGLSTHQVHAASLLTREQADIAAQSIQMTDGSPDTPLSEIKAYFLFSVLTGKGTTAYCGDIRRMTWIIAINPDKTQGWRTGNGWNGGYPFLIDAATGKIWDCRS